MIAMLPPIPVLRILDEQKARAFYLGVLGLAVDWEHRHAPGMPLYMQVSRDNCVLHLSEHAGDGVLGSAVFLPMEGIRAYRDAIVSISTLHSQLEVYDQPWGWSELHLIDPFGNKLRFAQRLTA